MLFCCLAGLPIQAAAFYSDSAKAMQLLARAEKAKDPREAITYTLQSLAIGTRLNNHAIIASSYRQLGYLYRNERKPQLYELDSLCVHHARLSGNETLLFDALQLIAKDYLNNNQVKQAAKYLPALDSLAMNTDTAFRKCVAEQVKAFYYHKTFRPALSLVHAQNSVYYARLLQNRLLTARSLSLVSTGFTHQMKHDSGAVYAFSALEEAKKTNNKEVTARIYSQLSFLYQVTGNLQQALYNYKNAISLFEQAGLPIEAAFVQWNITDIHFTQHHNDSAFISINKALQAFRKYHYQQGLGFTYSYLGRYYAKMKLKDSAEYYTALSKTLLKEVNNPFFSFYVKGYEMANAIETGDSLKYDSLLHQLIARAPKVMPRELLSGAVDLLAIPGLETKEKKRLKEVFLSGDSSEVGPLSLDTFQESAQIINPFTGTLPALDSLITQQQHKKIAEIEARYKVKEARDSTKLAQKESLLAKQQLNQRNLVLIFSFLLLAVSGLLLYVQVKNRKRAMTEKKRALEDKTTIEHLKNELDHRVGNTLNNISFIIRLVKGRSSDSASFELLEEKIDPLMVLYRTLSENKTEDITLQEYFEKICQGLKTSYDHDDKIAIHIDAPVTMSGSKAGRIGLILNELVTNSFKHAFTGQATGHISVICKMTDHKQYYLSVTDSGPGIQQQVNHGTQKGLLLVKALAQQLEATIREKQEAGVGFEFYFL